MAAWNHPMILGKTSSYDGGDSMWLSCLLDMPAHPKRPISGFQAHIKRIKRSFFVDWSTFIACIRSATWVPHFRVRHSTAAQVFLDGSAPGKPAPDLEGRTSNQRRMVENQEILEYINTQMDMLYINIFNGQIYTDWWFGTVFMFPYIGNHHPNWLTNIFSEGLKPPTRR